MQQNPAEPVQSDTTIASLLAQFVRAIREVFRKAREDAAYFNLVRSEAEYDRSSEAAIKSKYADAWYRSDELRRRAAERGIKFSLSASHAHQAAILDFLDNPHAPTMLNWGPMTWFYSVNDDGSTTSSCTHPAMRAKYVWNAVELDRRRPTGIARVDEALKALKSFYPVERISWTEQQWREYEQRPGARFGRAEDQPTVVRPAHEQSEACETGIPLRL